jgi:carbamoyltransferase
MLQKIKKITNKKKIVLCGGVSLNCKAITDVAKNHSDIEIFVPPSPGDSGSAIGAAFFALYQESKKLNFCHKSPFIGPNRKNIINKNDLNYFFKVLNGSKKNTLSEIYKLINDGEIIATFLGKSEIGPRALGNTSIICDALNKKTVNQLNNIIKKRDKFQPLAPMVLEKNFDKYFIKQKNIYKNHEWMGALCKFKQTYHRKFKSIAHVDGTLRTQVVKHGEIKNLLNFLDKKKIKILINTSFNISKDPFVFDLIDVYVNMKRMNIKYLYCIDRIYIIK